MDLVDLVELNVLFPSYTNKSLGTLVDSIRHYQRIYNEPVEYITQEKLLDFLRKLVEEEEGTSVSTVRVRLSNLRQYLLQKKGVEVDSQAYSPLLALAKKRSREKKTCSVEYSDQNVSPLKFKGYNLSQVKQISKYLLDLEHYQHRLVILTRCFACARAEMLEDITWEDVFVTDPPGPISSLTLHLRKSKTSGTCNDQQYLFVGRNRDPSVCPISALALCCVQKYKFKKPLLNEKPYFMNRSTHKSMLIKMHKELGIHVEKLTHCGRNFASNYMKQSGKVSDDSMRRMGLWKSIDVFSTHYLDNPPWDAIQVLAGYDPDTSGQKDNLPQPSLELKKEYCFGWLEKGQYKLFQFLADVYLQDFVRTNNKANLPDNLKDFASEVHKKSGGIDSNPLVQKRIRELEQEYSKAIEDLRKKSKKLVSKSYGASYDPDNGFHLQRGICSVKEIAEEYLFGIQERPSIMQLNQELGASWRSKNHSEKSLYSFRKPIYDFIDKLLDEEEGSKIKVFQKIVSLSEDKSVSAFKDWLKK